MEIFIVYHSTFEDTNVFTLTLESNTFFIKRNKYKYIGM